jgi:hypothetical protein
VQQRRLSVRSIRASSFVSSSSNVSPAVAVARCKQLRTLLAELPGTLYVFLVHAHVIGFIVQAMLISFPRARFFFFFYRRWSLNTELGASKIVALRFLPRTG